MKKFTNLVLVFAFIVLIFSNIKLFSQQTLEQNYGNNPIAGKYAEVNGIKLYYEIYGEGYPLLILHGNASSIIDGAPFYPELSKKYKVIAIDTRGQGKSTDNDKEFTYELFAADVNALLEQLNIDSVYIWGFSDGANTGLILTMNYPKKVKKLLAFGGTLQPDSSAVSQWMINSNKQTILITTKPDKKKLAILMDKHPNIQISELKKIQAPVLVVAGDRDIIRLEHTMKIFENIPNSQLCIIPGTTHGAPWEKQELFLTILTDFFDKPFSAPSTEMFKEYIEGLYR
ncbi:MAG TPA: alpha/beta hydrolase [Ignavibacteriaceae bacterium]|nr:alpha/beta hydrolase [Ignavibacteriaceae bacterium]